MITGDALLDFGDGHKLNVAPNRAGIFITACPPVIRRYFPGIRLEKWRYDLEYKVSSDYALAAKCIKPVMHLKTQWSGV